MSPAVELDLDLALAYDLKEHMSAMFALGYSLMSLGKGPDGKEPSVEFEGRSRFPLKLVGDRMALMGASMYGVRCDGLVVVDIDNMDPATLDYAERRFGPSPYVVRTQDGEHRYYRNGDVAKFATTIRNGNIKIDVKCGQNSYVVGPGSIRHDNGFVYRMVGEPLPPIHELPVFRDRGTGEFPQLEPRGNKKNTDPHSFSAESMTGLSSISAAEVAAQPVVVDLSGSGIPRGQRNDTLCRKAVAFAVNTASPESLFEELTAYAHATFSTMEDFGPALIRKIANWAWALRRDDKLKSQTRDRDHDERMAFAAVKNGGDGYLLTQHLQYCHGAQPGKRFAICRDAMAGAETLPEWSEWNYRMARNAALAVGRIVRVYKAKKRKGDCDLFQLRNLPRGRGRRGEGV